MIRSTGMKWMKKIWYSMIYIYNYRSNANLQLASWCWYWYTGMFQLGLNLQSQVLITGIEWRDNSRYHDQFHSFPGIPYSYDWMTQYVLISVWSIYDSISSINVYREQAYMYTFDHEEDPNWFCIRQTVHNV